MNILEALNTGKRFRRPHWDIWYSIDMEEPMSLCPEELLAEDWEVEDRGVVITTKQFTEACNRTAQLLYPLPGHNMLRIWEYIDTLKKELGL